MTDTFTGLARNAAAMNTEDAFDRCLDEIRKHGFDRSGARLSYILRTSDMSREDSRLEFAALCQAHTYLQHQTPEDIAVGRNQVSNARGALATQLAALKAYPEQNTDPFAVRRPRDAWGFPV